MRISVKKSAFRIVTGITALLILLFMADASPVEEWNRTFAGTGNDTASSVRQASGGGYIISGRTCPHDASQCGPWLIKTDVQGNEEWNKTFPGVNGTSSVQQTKDGGYLLSGWSLIRTDRNGSEQWARKFGEGYLNSVLETSDGGYIGAGCIMKLPGDDHPDGWTVKVSSNGDEQWNWASGEWNRTLTGRGLWANSVVQASDGGYLMVGTMEVPTGLAAMFIKIDDNGSMQWSKNRIFNEKIASVANSARQTEDGGYIIAGESHSEGGWNKDGWLIKLYENGTEQWNMIFGGPEEDEFLSVWNTGDGGYVVAGTTSDSSGRSYAKLIKVKGEKAKPVEIPKVSPTVTLKASQTQTLTAVPTETLKVSPSKKVPGFEVVPAITIFLAVYKTGRKRW